ncbi:MAG: hypothetical protein AAEJ04_04215 [Planctomycetota bacterium]
MSKAVQAALISLFLVTATTLAAQDSTWKRTDSDAPYDHRIQLRDSAGRIIDPGITEWTAGSSGADLKATCAPCHDVEAASAGLHGGAGIDGRRGEPWFLIDPRSGTSLPIHRRSWSGIQLPAELDLDESAWTKIFGRHETGHGSGSDCLVCHLATGYDFSKRIERFDAGDASRAPFIAAGLLDTNGKFDLPRFDSEGHIKLDLLADAGTAACLPCHTVRNLETDNNPNWRQDQWFHDGDVHLAAGLSCVDCHRSGIDHHIVRGYEGEKHPAGTDVSSLTCRGCHMDEKGGHLGAPKPRHAGLPPFHLEEIHCTGCHSGPEPKATEIKQWTSRAHRLGEPSQKRNSETPPRIIWAGIDKDETGKLGPVRQSWPDGWGLLSTNGTVRPLAPALLRRPLRKSLRIRANLREEVLSKLGDQQATEKIHDALTEIGDSIPGDEVAVFISGGRVLRSDGNQGLIEIPSDVSTAVSWPVAHPVRSARTSIGSGGCIDCHSSDSRWLSSPIAAKTMLPLPGGLAVTSPLQSNIIEEGRWRSWWLLFAGRDVGKIYFSLCTCLCISGSLLAIWQSLGRNRP